MGPTQGLLLIAFVYILLVLLSSLHRLAHNLPVIARSHLMCFFTRYVQPGVHGLLVVVGQYERDAGQRYRSGGSETSCVAFVVFYHWFGRYFKTKDDKRLAAFFSFIKLFTTSVFQMSSHSLCLTV